MAFRTETSIRVVAGIAMCAALAAAQPLEIPVRHRHLRGGVAGTLAFTAEGVRFTEPGKRSGHSRTWAYTDLQQFSLAPDGIRIRTYEDVRWQAGRDREYRFDGLPEGAAAKLYAMLAPRLEERFIAELAPPSAGAPLWEAPAKLLRGTGGFNGTLRVTDDRIVFDGGRGSRTWRYSDIENLSSAGAYELSVTSLDGETRFQLKQPLPEARYNTLWRRITGANGLNPFLTSKETSHD